MSAAHPTLVHALRHWAAQTPDAVVFRWFEDGETETARLTYGELDRRARGFAAQLQARGLAGQRAMLLFPPGLEFIVALYACMYAGVVAVPAYPPEPHRLEHTLRRLESIIADAKAPAVVSSAQILAFAEQVFGNAAHAGLGALQWLDLQETAAPEAWADPGLTPESLAFLQYTSGSTAAPKGVMLTHGGLIANLEMMRAVWGTDRDMVCACWLPLYHDLGLIGHVLQPAYVGGRALLMPPYAFLKRPPRWLHFLSRHQVTMSGGPNFAFDLCLRKISEAERATLDLSHVKVLANGAEPVRAETLARFRRAFAPVGLAQDVLTPSYGMAELGLFASAAREDRAATITIDKAALEAHAVAVVEPGHPRALTLVSSGQAWLDARIFVVHPETRALLPEDRVGEIWISGPHVAAGYWGRPELTEATFAARLADGSGPFLRTGDLGFLRGDEIFVTGRRKDMLIIRGRNLYPHDIEATLDGCRAALPALRPGCAAAVSLDVADEERLIVLQEMDPRRDPDFDPARAISVIRDAVARDHEVQAHRVVLLKRGTLPKTSSGKVMRHACKRALVSEFAEGGLVVIAEDTRAVVSPIDPASPAGVRPPDAEARAASAAQADHLVAWLRGFAARRDLGAGLDPGAVFELGAQGLLGMQAPRALGGLALTVTDMGRISAQAGALDAGLAMLLHAQNALGVSAILRADDPALQERLLPGVLQGRGLVGLAFAEPQAGHGGGIAAEVRAEGAARLLHGEKAWVTAGPWLSHMVVIAREGDGLSAFVLHRGAPGLTVGEPLHLTAAGGVPVAHLRLDGVRVGDEDRVGPPGQGAAIAAGAAGLGRILMGFAAIGAMKRALQLATRYASRRSIVSGWLLDDPVALGALTEAVAIVTGLEALGGAIAGAVDAGEPVPKGVIDVFKVAAAEASWAMADRLVQVLGARGFVEANMAPRMLRGARLLRVSDGPTEALLTEAGAALLSEPEPHLGFLRDALGGAEAAAVVSEAIELAQGAGRRRRGPPAGACALGELLGRAALAAAVANPGRDKARSQAAALLDERLAAGLAAVRAAVADRPASSRALMAQVQAFAGSVGEIEDAFGAATLDPLLAKGEGPSGRAPRSRPRPESAPRPAPPARVRPAATRRAPQDEAARLEAWMVTWLARELGVAPAGLARQLGGPEPESFHALGIDSVMAVQFVAALEEKLKISLPASALWDHDTVGALARFLLAQRRG